MIQTNNLTFQYQGQPLISFPDFKVKGSEALLICGESGCGKTTLLHLLAVLRQSLSGEIKIGEDKTSAFQASKMDQFRGENIGIVYQNSYFIESLSVLDNLLISPYSADRERAMIIAERLNISDILLRKPNRLSVGQQQRATIARAVMNSPKLLLADEPTSALDNKNCKQVINLLLEEANSNNAALVIVTHDDRLRSEISACIDLNSYIN